MAVASAGLYASLHPMQTTTPTSHHSVFYRPDALPDAQPTASKHTTHYNCFTHTQPFYGSVEFVRDNQGEPVPQETFTHSHSSWSSIILICLLHLLRSMASSLFNPRALRSFSTMSLQVFFSLPLGLAPPLHTLQISSPNHNLITAHAHTIATCFALVPRLCMSSNPSLSLNSLLGTLSCSFMPHIHLTILISAL